MISAEKFFGRAHQQAISSDLTITPLLARTYSIQATGGAAIKLPAGDALYMRLGTPQFFIWNNGVNSLPIKNTAGTTLATLAVDDIAEIGLTRLSANGSWIIRVAARIT